MAGRRVLVIDDSSTLRKVVEIALRGTGCEVEFAVNGHEGVALARQRPPDVILLDYLLPDLRSVEVCQRLGDDAATAQVPVVIMSANQRGVLDEFRQLASVVGFIAKPFTAPEVRARLEGAIHRGSAADSAAHAGHASRAEGGELQLAGDLAVTPLAEVLRLLSATHATGVLVVHDRRDAATEVILRISLRRGEILLGATTAVGALEPQLAPELRERVTRNAALGKPMQITLAEAGAMRTANLPFELHAASTRLIADAFDARAGRFAWEATQALPEFVEAFGRHVSLTGLALDHARRTGGAVSGASSDRLDRVYDRAPRFSHKIAGAQLDGAEQRVLGLVDGRASARELAARSGLPSDRVAAALTRLCAADLIAPSTASSAAIPRTLAVLDADRDGVIAPLRARLGRLARPVEVVELDPARPVSSAVLEVHAELVWIGVAALTRDVLEHELPILARDGGIAVVGVLDAPNPALSSRLLQAGLHAVLTKPVHVHEIERLLSVTRTQEPPCPPFSS